MRFLLAIDQGTTSTRVVVYNEQFEVVSSASSELEQSFPQPGWVEHDAMQIWWSVLDCGRQALAAANLTGSDIAGIGVTNQRETTVLWDRETGLPVAPAIVWQDRRTAQWCDEFKEKTTLDIQAKTGLVLDPYFSATKIYWLLQQTPDLKRKATLGQLAFGTIDSWLLWQLTGGQVHATDATNAARTLLFNLEQQQWDAELLALFEIPAGILPTVCDNQANFGRAIADHFGHEIPIYAMIGDQQAALVGQACFQPGMMKSTYGTGTFLVLNTGKQVITSSHGMLATVGYRLNGKVTYALEGSSFSAGVIIQWLRDKLGIIGEASESEALAASVDSTEGVVLVPAFTGLGAPHWDPNARAAIHGITRGTTAAHIVRAGLEAVAYQTVDLVAAMQADGAMPPIEIRVDGGMVANQWLMQFLADMLASSVVRSQSLEATALGAAYLAAIGAGWISSLADIEALWQADHHFTSQMSEKTRQAHYQAWQQVLANVLTG